MVKKKLSDQILSKYNIVNGTGKITITPITMNETVYFDIGSEKSNAKKFNLHVALLILPRHSNMRA